jgi:hypothetical protein
MVSIIEQLMDRGELFFITLVAGSILLGMLIKSVTGVLTTASRERTKREIAAYVAEGSMTPEQAERILKAGDRAAA